MATVKNGFLGDAIGKLGNVVFRKWNSLITVSKYQPMVKNPNSLAQQAQRLKIKNLAQALQPFRDNAIPLNFTNRKGRSTAWAEAIRANYPLLDETGNIDFQNMILSGGHIIPPLIFKAFFDPFINQFYIKYEIENDTILDTDCIRLTAIGRRLIDGNFNTSNICKLPFNNIFSTYIHELDLPDWPLNFDFGNLWSEGLLFYNIINDPSRDVRAYYPANIINVPSAGSYFSYAVENEKFDFSINDRIIMPDSIDAKIFLDVDKWSLKFNINDYTKYPNLNADDLIVVIPCILEPNANTYYGPYQFPAVNQVIIIPLIEGDQNKPFNILYTVTNSSGACKSAVTRIAFNHPSIYTYCELLCKNGFIHPDSVRINSPFTAIWGDLKDFIPGDLIPSVAYKIISKNETTLDIKEHVINSDNLFFCSKLLRNQIYTITIKDGETVSAEFDVIGLDDDYSNYSKKPRPRKIVRFRAGNDLASKVK